MSQLYQSGGDPIIIRRSDIEALLAYPKSDRDQLILSLPAKMGFRASEIRMLRKELVDLEGGCIYVVDSKKQRKYPIPLAWDVARLIEKCMAPGKDFIIRSGSRNKRPDLDRPLNRGFIYYITRRLAVRAGLPNWDQVNTTLLRHYFAATWTYVLKGSIESLRRILRHKNLGYTQCYLARLVFFEDLKREVDRLRQIPSLEEGKMLNPECDYQSSDFFVEYCSNCVHLPVCKYCAEACASSKWSKGCKRFLNVQEVKAEIARRL